MSEIPFDTTQNFIAGEWRSAASNETLSLENPSDGTELTRIARGGVADIDRAVAAARDALAGPWGRMTAAERGRLLAGMGRLVLEKADKLAQLEARDVGKPLNQARADALALARYLEFYAGAADKLHGETIPYLQRLYGAAPCASRMASPAISFPGTIRCRSSAAASAPRWPRATPRC